MATLVPCLVRLRAEFNMLFPARDERSDGWIGDAAHQAEHSDHNPDARGLVHAIDVDTDLGDNADMQDFVNYLVARHETRLTYIIFERTIWSASHNWNGRLYTGSDPHTGHVHISADYTPKHENDTSSYHLEDAIMPTTDQIVDALLARKITASGKDYGTINGILATLMARTGSIANTQLPAIAGQIEQINEKIDEPPVS